MTKFINCVQKNRKILTQGFNLVYGFIPKK